MTAIAADLEDQAELSGDLTALPSGSGFNRQLNNIAAFLVNLDIVAPEQIDVSMTNPVIKPSGKATSRGGFIAYRQTYECVIIVERYPHKNLPIELLFTHICTWLMDNDGNRTDGQNADIVTDVEENDEYTADVTISIVFNEDIEIIPDPTGTIFLNNTRFRLANAALDYAQEGDVIAD